jgi:hypothetical protein
MQKSLFILIFIFCGCKENTNRHDNKLMNNSYVEDYNNKDKIDKLCKRVLIEGDTLAFRELKYIYLISEHSEEFLYFSTIMAEKYNYGPAFQTNYDILKLSNQSTQKKLAIYNLLKSYELGNKNGLQRIKEIFPKGIPKAEEYLDN